MAALTASRATKRRAGDLRYGEAAAGAKIYQGALIMRNSAGYLIQGKVLANGHGVGVCIKSVDNSAGADGAARAEYRGGTYLFENASSSDALTRADIGNKCFILDDQTVAKTNGSNARSPAGIVVDIDPHGVWVRLDESIINL